MTKCHPLCPVLTFLTNYRGVCVCYQTAIPPPQLMLLLIGLLAAHARLPGLPGLTFLNYFFISPLFNQVG